MEYTIFIRSNVKYLIEKKRNINLEKQIIINVYEISNEE